MIERSEITLLWCSSSWSFRVILQFFVWMHCQPLFLFHVDNWIWKQYVDTIGKGISQILPNNPIWAITPSCGLSAKLRSTFLLLKCLQKYYETSSKVTILWKIVIDSLKWKKKINNAIFKMIMTVVLPYP